MLTTTVDIFTPQAVRQSTPSSATIVITPPTFAGIATLTENNLNGSYIATWLAATYDSPPIWYEVYVQKTTATDLFNTANIQQITQNLSAVIFTNADTTPLVIGATYFVGVRAINAIENRDLNTVSISDLFTSVNLGSLAASIAANSYLDLDLETKVDQKLDMEVTIVNVSMDIISPEEEF